MKNMWVAPKQTIWKVVNSILFSQYTLHLVIFLHELEIVFSAKRFILEGQKYVKSWDTFFFVRKKKNMNQPHNLSKKNSHKLTGPQKHINMESQVLKGSVVSPHCSFFFASYLEYDKKTFIKENFQSSFFQLIKCGQCLRADFRTQLLKKC